MAAGGSSVDSAGAVEATAGETGGDGRRDSRWALIVAAVLVAVHLVASVLHGGAHVGADVVLHPVVEGVVLLSVYVLPGVGLLVVWRGAVRRGAAVLAWSLAASLALGVALHFLVAGPDNVASVGPGAWAGPFLYSAVVVALVDGAAAVVAAGLWWARTGDRAAVPAMGRLAGVPWTGFRPLTRLAYYASRRWFGEVPASLPVMAHHRGVLAGTSAFETALLAGERVDDRLVHLAVEKAAMEVGCSFCIDIGAAEATRVGITDEQLRDLPIFEESDAFSDRERLVLRYAVAMSATPAEVPDGLFEELAAAFDEVQLVELTAAIAWEHYRARFNHAVGLGAQGFADGVLPEVIGHPTEAAGGASDAA